MSRANPMHELFNDFVLDGQERLGRVEEILLNLRYAEIAARDELLIVAKRELHTLKGNAGMMGFTDLQSTAHGLEDQVEALDPSDPDVVTLLDQLDRLHTILERLAGRRHSDEDAAVGAARLNSSDRLADSVRVPFADLDALVDVLAEMVIFRNRLGDAVTKGRLSAYQNRAWDEVEDAEEALGATLNIIQERVMSLRMVPLRTMLVSLQRIVHDVQSEHGKEIAFEVTGGDTAMDKALLEVASEALGHLVRNAAIHGIEDPAARELAGKSRQGLIRLDAVTESGEVVISVADDGQGIDSEALMAAAQANGISTASLEDPNRLLFHAGLSTRSDADLSSGRGIGLSAVQESVHRLGGRITVASRPGKGSRFRLILPLSVSITRALLVKADGESYALPINYIEESLPYSASDATEVNHSLVLQSRDEVIALLDLGLVFATSSEPRDHGYVVLIESGGKRRGLIVDEINGIREIVVKGLDDLVGSPAGISGSTILGDGRVVLILDSAALAEVATSCTQKES